MKVILGKKSNIKIINDIELVIMLKEKFKSERGRINCSLWEEGGRWRWLGNSICYCKILVIKSL